MDWEVIETKTFDLLYIKKNKGINLSYMAKYQIPQQIYTLSTIIDQHIDLCAHSTTISFPKVMV